MTSNFDLTKMTYTRVAARGMTQRILNHGVEAEKLQDRFVTRCRREGSQFDLYYAVTILFSVWSDLDIKSSALRTLLYLPKISVAPEDCLAAVRAMKLMDKFSEYYLALFQVEVGYLEISESAGKDNWIEKHALLKTVELEARLVVSHSTRRISRLSEDLLSDGLHSIEACLRLAHQSRELLARQNTRSGVLAILKLARERLLDTSMMSERRRIAIDAIDHALA